MAIGDNNEHLEYDQQLCTMKADDYDKRLQDGDLHVTEFVFKDIRFT